jgi:L-ribulose-5-phosphate 3-epimerase
MMKLGVMIKLDETVEARFATAAEMGFPTAQLVCWQEAFFTDDYAQRVRSASATSGVEVSAFWCGYGGPVVWDNYMGPETIGLVPPAYRFQRVQTLVCGAAFAQKLGVKDLITHAGFLPEEPFHPHYAGVIAALRYVAQACLDHDLYFLFETGEETPTSLLRTIEEIGLPNLGVNLDPANLLLYGRGNPVDSLDVIGRYIRGVHAKDGCYPTNGRQLGEEKALGEGRVNFPALLRGLKALGYDGALTIEREIEGPQQTADIITGKQFLEQILAELED